MAKRQSFFDELLYIGLNLPLKVALPASVVTFVGLHVAAIKTQIPVTTTTLAGLGGVVQLGFIHVFAQFLQYLIPAGLLIGATVGYFKRSRDSSLLEAARENPKTAVSSMSWRDFERLVGEAFRRQGFQVSGFGGQGPDGGVDLGLTKNGQRYLVQCKHWRTRQVGVTVVRELNGVMAAQGAQGGFVVTGGEFTKEAREFAKDTHIELIDGPKLHELIGNAASLKEALTPALESAGPATPVCPRCGTPMVRREARQGKFAGQVFWGCGRYPKCSGIARIS